MTICLPDRSRLTKFLVLGLYLAGSFHLHAEPPASPADKPNYAVERQQRAEQITRPYGWMSLIALKEVKPGITSVGSAKGNSLVLDHGPTHLVDLENKDGRTKIQAADPTLTYRGRHPDDTTELSPGEGDSDALVSGSVHLWLIKRGNQQFLRVKDSEAPALVHKRDLRWYGPNDRYRVAARWVPDAGGHKLQTVNKLGQLSETTVPGHVEFDLNGRKLTLVPLEASNDSLWFVFRDETYRTDTDQGGRFLTVKSPASGLERAGSLVLDFNEAVNPPCAYTPYATCPLAAKENRLPVAIPAGEKRYEP